MYPKKVFLIMVKFEGMSKFMPSTWPTREGAEEAHADLRRDPDVSEVSPIAEVDFNKG